ncbi:DUF2723 domain-containing protein [candidate division KSB1 bacterium]|nr:DUF2723 domain-containing protein [candidate division KSB1 bacterium]
MVKFDTHRWVATGVFLASLVVYALTMADTCSFWDCGEFAACSYTMGVPHPPGSPLFLLIGRVFTILPISADIGVRATWMSVLASAFSILLAYLIIVRLIRHIRGREESGLDQWITYGGGVVGALSLSWSYSMWFNAVESEVYAMSQLFTHLVVWLILVWHEKADEAGNERWLMMIGYTIGLSTGVHLLMVLALPALALVMYFRRRSFQLASFAAMAAGTAVAFVMIYPGVVKWLPGLATRFGSFWAVAAVVAVIGLIFWWAVKNQHGIIGVAMGSLLLITIGYSSYSMIYIRSGLNPSIDENDPDTPARYLSYLNREQYGDRKMFPRMWNKNPEYRSESDFFWRYQVNKMFNRYLFWQFIGREGAPQEEFQDAGVSPNYSILSAITQNPQGILRWLAILTCVPFTLGLIGIFHQFAKDKTGWLFVAALFFMTGYAVILYLNQDDPQPRERDYSYVGAFFAYALWIGIGAAAVIEWVAKRIQQESSRPAAAIATTVLLLLLSPVMLLANNYEMNDRDNNYVAWDYSYNMLMSCEPNGLLFTNGDNDTFPVWYLQEVAGVRKDVRLVNLSLLNTGWYIKQLKHREPMVPISYTDQYIDRYLEENDAQAIMARYWPPDKQKIELNTSVGKMAWTMPAAMYIPFKEGETSRTPNFLRVQDMMILDMLKTNYDPSKTPVPRPIYFAVTVANSNMIGLRDWLTMEGLVFKVNPKKDQQIDPVRIQEHLFKTFQGHFRGIDDPGVHFDDNVSKLLQNYRSAFLQLAYYYSNLPDTGATAAAPAALADRLENFNRLPNRQKALTLLEQMDSAIPEAIRPIGNPDLSVQLGRMYADLGKPEELRRRLEMATSREDLRFDSQCRLAAMWISSFGDTAQAHKILRSALGANPTGEMYYQAGGQLYQSQAFSIAADMFEQALKLDANDGQAVGALMQALEALGDTPRAKRVLNDWIAKHPTDAGAKRRLDQLDNRGAVDSIAAAPTK